MYIFCSKLLSCCTDEKINGVEIIEDQSFPAVLELGLLAVYLGGFWELLNRDLALGIVR